jgi:hypothetical protein
MASGERLHKEFELEVGAHKVSTRAVESAVRADASLVWYRNHEGHEALGLWDPHSHLFVVAMVPDGLVLTAYELRDEQHWARYIRQFEVLGWLRR